MTRTRIAIFAAATLAFAAAATEASAFRNNYTDEPVPGFLPLILGEGLAVDPNDGYPGYRTERPIRRHARPQRPGWRQYDDVPPPPFHDQGY